MSDQVSSTTEKGEVNVQTSHSASPAFISGHPFTGESKTKQFFNSAFGYLISFIIATIIILSAVILP